MGALLFPRLGLLGLCVVGWHGSVGSGLSALSVGQMRLRCVDLGDDAHTGR